MTSLKSLPWYDHLSYNILLSHNYKIASKTFDYSYTIIDCSSATSIEDIYNDVLSPDARANHRPARPWLNTEAVRHLGFFFFYYLF